MQLIYKPFEDEEEETNNVYQQAEAFAASAQGETITDVRSAASVHSHIKAIFCVVIPDLSCFQCNR